MYKKWHFWMEDVGNWFQSPLLLFMRLFWGFWYVRSGVIKLLHLGDLTTYFSGLEIPMAEVAAVVTGVLHLVGGVCLVIGLASRLASVPLAVTMIVAYLTVYIEDVKTLLIDPVPFVLEIPFLFLLTNIMIIAFGPGKISVDYLLEKKWRKDESGVH